MRITRFVVEDPAVCSGATVHSQAGVVVPAHQRLSLCLLSGSFTQARAARAQLSQHKLTDAKVKAQNHNVDHIDQQKTGGVVPGNQLRHSDSTLKSPQ